MQLVGGRVKMLNPAKGDLLIDAKKVEELMGVPPEPGSRRDGADGRLDRQRSRRARSQ